MLRYKKLLNHILTPYSAIIFLDNKIANICLLLITFINPSVAISGIIAVIFTTLLAELIDLREAYVFKKFYVYNSLLVGMAIGYLVTPSIISVTLIIISTTFTFLLSFILNRLFNIYKIPILSLPFSIVAMFVYSASLKYSVLLSNLANNSSLYDINLPIVISVFFKSLGTIFFLPNTLAGLLIFIVVISFSRVMALMALSSFYFGIVLQGFLVGSIMQTLENPYAFNYILVGISLGGIFLLPTLKNFVLSFIAVAISVVLVDAITNLFQYYALPIFTIPFNITVMVFIFILSTTNYKGFNNYIKSTPENH